MSEYGYEVNKITTLNDISGNGSFWYEYKGLNFLSKRKSNNENLVVMFHGCIPEKTRNVFRGYNYVIENTDIVCVSNMLTNIYPDLRLSWYLSSKKYDVHGLCSEVFRYLLHNKTYKNVIFTGTSSGSYPSVRYASIFNKTAIISNPQIYLELNSLYKHAKKMINKSNDDFIYDERYIEYIIKNNKPQKIILYQNTLDDDNYSAFVKFMDNGYSDIFKFIPFKGPDILESGKTQHHYRFPENKSHLIILKDYIAKMSGS